MPVPVVPGYIVRAITMEDAEPWARYVCLPEVMEHTSSTAHSADDLKPMLERIVLGGADSPIRFVVQQSGSTAILATVGFHTISTLNGTAEITYDVAPHLWGKGIATLVCRAATIWGFETRGWHRIQGTTVLLNLRSQGVLERCGYLREGVLRNFRIVRGTPTDYYMYSAVPGDVMDTVKFNGDKLGSSVTNP